MVSWFDDAPAPPPAWTAENWVTYLTDLAAHSPPWMGPPDNWNAVKVPWRLVLADDEKASVDLSRFAVYPTGVKFEVILRWDPEHLDIHTKPGERPRILVEGNDPASPRLGIGFADGRKAVLGPAPISWREGHRPVLHPSGGGRGGVGTQTGGLWLWPLPPDGPLTFVLSWDVLDLDERIVTVDATELVDASRLSRQQKGGTSLGDAD